MMAPPDSADFDVVAIDASDDAEAAARIVAARRDVEYAQPAYRFHPRFKPNDPLYSRQWNLPDIDMERALTFSRPPARRSRSPCSTVASPIRTRRARTGHTGSVWTATATS
jgi:hypothetical protein